MLLIAVLTAMLALPGCGGGDGSGEGKPVSDKEDQAKLLVSQANADIRTFCLRSGAKTTKPDLENVVFIDAVRSVNVLIDQHRENPSIEVPLDEKNPAVPLDKVVRDNLTTLQRSCGSDGRLLAGRLQRGISAG